MQTPKWRSVLIESKTAAYPFRHMTFPKFRPFLAAAGTNPNVFGVGAVDDEGGDGGPLGLALGYLNPNGRRAELMSLFVAKDARRKGIGLALTESLESMVAMRGYRELATVYMNRNPSIPHLEKILTKLGWTEPTPRFRVIRARISDILTSPIADRFHRIGEKSLANLKVVPWRGLTGRQRAKLKVAVQTQSWAPADLNPFDFEGVGLDGAQPELDASFVCLRDEAIIGWHMVHRINAKTLRFSCSYMRPSSRSAIAMFHTWEHSLRSGLENGFETISWAVPPHHADMSGFTDRILSPHAIDDNFTFGTSKMLALSH